MFGKPIKDLSYQDIYDLVYVQKQDEGHHLDYKGEPKNIDEFANKIIKTFSSFANAHGGYVIFGVEEADKKNKIFKIGGISKSFSNKSFVEWLNQNISGNIEPKLFYPDPKVIEIPESGKIIVVYHIPESTKKPHFNNRESKYFVRQNDISEAAKHYTIRDMFEISRRRYDEFNEFLDKRNLLNENSKEFGLNSNSRMIASETFTKDTGIEQPIFLLSFIPKFPNEQKIATQKPEFAEWLKLNSKGYEPLQNFSAFPTYKKEFNLNGLTYQSYKKTSYIEFGNNGFFELGLCDTVFWIWKQPQYENKNFLTIHITWCIGLFISLLHFAKKYYDFINYDDEIVVQLSFRNVLNYIITGMNSTEGRREWGPFLYEIPSNKSHDNFKIFQNIAPSNLTDSIIIEIAKDCAEKIMLACGVNDISRCFIEDKIDVRLYSHISGI
jgi:Putative DNA-binding domain